MNYIRFLFVLYWFAPFLKFGPLPSENPRCELVHWTVDERMLYIGLQVNTLVCGSLWICGQTYKYQEGPKILLFSNFGETTSKKNIYINMVEFQFTKMVDQAVYFIKNILYQWLPQVQFQSSQILTLENIGRNLLKCIDILFKLYTKKALE